MFNEERLIPAWNIPMEMLEMLVLQHKIFLDWNVSLNSLILIPRYNKQHSKEYYTLFELVIH